MTNLFLIFFLKKIRYAKNPSLYAVELINEPLAPEVTLDMVKKLYQDGYNAVRKHSSTAYVVMSNRLGSPDATELLTFASGLKGSVIDVHYYNLFSNIFDNMSVQQNLDYVNTNRTDQLNTVTQSNGPLTFVGMFSFSSFHYYVQSTFFAEF